MDYNKELFEKEYYSLWTIPQEPIQIPNYGDKYIIIEYSKYPKLKLSIVDNINKTFVTVNDLNFYNCLNLLPSIKCDCILLDINKDCGFEYELTQRYCYPSKQEIKALRDSHWRLTLIGLHREHLRLEYDENLLKGVGYSNEK